MATQLIENYPSKPYSYANITNSNCDHKLVTDEEKGEIFCGKCGQIMTERIENRDPENKMYSGEEYMQLSRNGMHTSLTIYDNGLSTVMDSSNVDFAGKHLVGNYKQLYSKLRMWDNRVKFKSVDRSLAKALIMLDAAASKLNLSEAAHENAAYIYRKAVDKKLTRGRSIEELMAASIYAACRNVGVPRSLRETSDIMSIPKKKLARTFRLLLKYLDLKLQPYDPHEFLSKIASILVVTEKTKRIAFEMLLKAKESELFAGKNHLVICACVLYIACLKNNEYRTQDNVADAAGITSVSIRNNTRYIMKKLGIAS